MKKWTNEELKIAVETSLSMKETLLKLNVKPTGNSYKQFKIYIHKQNLNTNHWQKSKILKQKKPIEYYLTKGNLLSSGSVKRIKNTLLENKCAICQINIWNEKPLSLQLDHIDGDNTNNLLENLRLLCPNCHSQTDTYCGKNVQGTDKRKQFCLCGNKKTGRAIFCIECTLNKKTKQKQIKKELKEQNRKIKWAPKNKIIWPSDDELLSLLTNNTFSGAAKILKISDNGIRKHLKVRGLLEKARTLVASKNLKFNN